MKKRINNIRVIKDDLNPETPEVLAASIIKIANALEVLTGKKEGLTQEAIVSLIFCMKGMTVTRPDIRLVLEGLNRLKSYYIQR